MATTYLEIVNEVLSEMNEVLLTSVTFANATNIQRHVKEAVNRAYFDVNNPEHKWPWLSAAVSQDDRYGNVVQETVAGQRWYLLNESATDFNDDYGHVDWQRFEITTEGVSGEASPYTNQKLGYTEIEEWRDHWAMSEADDTTGSCPLRVIRNPDGRRFGLSPIPDKVYKVYYYAWARPVKLENHDSILNFPDQFKHVLVARARYYAWQRKEHPENSQLALTDYKTGLRGMRQQSIDQAPDSLTDDRIRFI